MSDFVITLQNATALHRAARVTLLNVSYHPLSIMPLLTPAPSQLLAA